MRANRPSIWLCSQAVAAFIERLAKRPPNSVSSTDGRNNREEDEPITAESNAGALASAGIEYRALVVTGTRGKGTESGNMPQGSMIVTNRKRKASKPKAEPANHARVRRHGSELEIDELVRHPAAHQ